MPKKTRDGDLGQLKRHVPGVMAIWEIRAYGDEKLARAKSVDEPHAIWLVPDPAPPHTRTAAGRSCRASSCLETTGMTRCPPISARSLSVASW